MTSDCKDQKQQQKSNKNRAARVKISLTEQEKNIAFLRRIVENRAWLSIAQ